MENPLKFKKSEETISKKEDDVSSTYENMLRTALDKTKQTISETSLEIEKLYNEKVSKTTKKKVDKLKNKLELFKSVSKYWAKELKNKFEK